MLKVYQDRTVGVDGYGNCQNACIASLLEIPLRECNDILPNQPGDWLDRWEIFLGDRGFKLTHHFVGEDSTTPPQGYAIATVQTERVYPDGHRKAGRNIMHAVVVYNGELVHDPFPLGSVITKVLYYDTLTPFTPTDKARYLNKRKGGVCKHGYLDQCVPCNSAQNED